MSILSDLKDRRPRELEMQELEQLHYPGGSITPDANAEKNGKHGWLIPVFSDLHVGSTVGLCPGRAIELDDGGTYTPNRAQRVLWDTWKDAWGIVKARSEELGWPVVTISNGDLVDGDHHNTHQLWSRDEMRMIDVAAEVLEPVIEVSDIMYFMRGTASHVGEQACLEEKVARDLYAGGAPVRPSPAGNASWWHAFLEFNYVTFDIHHHPESGSMRPYTAGGDVNRISVILFYEYWKTRMAPPDIALRSHKHEFRDGGSTHPTRSFVTAPWQMMTAFGHRIALGSKVPEVGLLLFYVYPALSAETRRYFCEPITYRPQRSPAHRVEIEQ